MEIEKQTQIFITVPYNRTLVVRLSCIIFVCKYRKKLLISKQISDDIKQFSFEICQKHNVIIRYMETDEDHVHYMIETEPTMSVSKIVNLMKSYTTTHFLDGYFSCSVENVSEEMLKRYIENQG